MRASFLRKSTPAPTPTELVGELVGELIAEAIFPLDMPPLSSRKGDCKIGVTLNPDSFYHAMAVMRGLRGHKPMSRDQIRDTGLAWLAKRECAGDCLLEGVFTRSEYRHLLEELLPVPPDSESAPPEFVKSLHGPSNPSDTYAITVSTPVVYKTPYEIGMRRALRAMQEKRSENRRPYLRYQPDIKKYYQESRPTHKRPPAAEHGQRMREYLATFVESQRDLRQHPTLYEVDAAAWALPERTPILLYYQDKKKKIKHLLLGPPRCDVQPYRFMWSGNDEMRFWPVVKEHEKEDAQRLVSECKGQLPDLLGRDHFEASSVWREQMCYAEETLSQQSKQPDSEHQAGGKVADQALAEWLDVSPDTVCTLREQLEIEQQWSVFGTCQDRREKRWAERDRRKETSQYKAVSIKMRVDDPFRWHSGGALRKHTHHHDPAVDAPIFDDPLQTLKVDKHEFWNFSVSWREKQGRNPSIDEVADRYCVSRRQAIQLIDRGEDDWRRRVQMDRSWEYPIKEPPDAKKREREPETAKERDQRKRRETHEWNQCIPRPGLYE